MPKKVKQHENRNKKTVAKKDDCGTYFAEAFYTAQSWNKSSARLGLADQSEKALYNRIYNRTTIDIFSVLKKLFK